MPTKEVSEGWQMEIQIIIKNDELIYPAKIYGLNSGVEFKDLKEIWKSVSKDGGIYVKGHIYSIDGRFIKDFSGKIEEEQLLSIAYINEENYCLDNVFTLQEAARKWFLADGSTIRKAIEREKFKESEIKQSGSVWLVTSEGMERVFGPMGVDNSYKINQKELFTSLSKVYLKDVKEGLIDLTSRDKEILEALEKKVVNIFINGYLSLKDGKIIVISNGVKEKPWQIINSFEEFMVFLGVLEKKRLLTEERKINIIKQILSSEDPNCKE